MRLRRSLKKASQVGGSSIAGQGVVAETLNFSRLHGYRIGGSIHIITNNHVVSPSGRASIQEITVTLRDRRSVTARVVGQDPEVDIALYASVDDYVDANDTQLTLLAPGEAFPDQWAFIAPEVAGTYYIAAVADPGDDTIYLLDHEPFPISGTSIRERQSHGLPIRELVPHEVNSYIEKYRLYRTEADGEHDVGR
mgnify:CR=1 FL=1